MAGKIVTADAMSMQKDIIDIIRKKRWGLPDRAQGQPARPALRGGGQAQGACAAVFLHRQALSSGTEESRPEHTASMTDWK